MGCSSLVPRGRNVPRFSRTQQPVLPAGDPPQALEGEHGLTSYSCQQAAVDSNELGRPDKRNIMYVPPPLNQTPKTSTCYIRVTGVCNTLELL